jgi:sigma-B regulation protein RsbU (phosphoserine phosphatase)
MVPIPLETQCQGCHGSDQKTRGVLIASFGMTTASKNALKQISSLSVGAFTRLLLPLGIIFFYITWVITNNISKIVQEVDEIVVAERYDKRITVVSNDEIGGLAVAFNHFISSVEDYRGEKLRETERLETAVFEKTKELREKNAFIEADLIHAGRVQQKLMPESFPGIKELRFHADYQPCLYIGGDYYDVIDMPNGHIGVFMADASGHGSSAALLVSIVKAVVTTVGKDISSPSYVVSMINSTLTKITPEESFVTLFYGVVNTITGTMDYTLAGHPSPVIHNRITGAFTELESNGGLVGIFELAKFEESRYSFKPGDRLFIYTDGLLEATTANNGGEPFGKKRLQLALVDKKDASPKEMTDYLIRNLRAFTGSKPLDDDVTILVMDYEKT